MDGKREKLNNGDTLAAFPVARFSEPHAVRVQLYAHKFTRIYSGNGSGLHGYAWGYVGRTPSGELPGTCSPDGLNFPLLEQNRARTLTRVNGPEVFRALSRAIHGRGRPSVRWHTPRRKARDRAALGIRAFFGFMSVSPAGRLRQTAEFLRRQGYKKPVSSRARGAFKRSAVDWLGEDERGSAEFARYVLAQHSKRARTARERFERRGLLSFLASGPVKLWQVAALLPAGAVDFLRQFYGSEHEARTQFRRFLVLAPERSRREARRVRPARPTRIPRPPGLLPLPPSAPLAPPA